MDVWDATRMQYLQQIITDLIKPYKILELSKTLNADECIARGCSLQSAFYSPTIRFGVDFKVLEQQLQGICIKYPHKSKEGKKSLEVDEIFPAGKQKLPVTKKIALKITEDFIIETFYSNKNAFPPNTPKELGNYHVKVKTTPNLKNVSVYFTLDENGIF